MDSISLKLIERNSLKRQAYTFSDIFKIMTKESTELSFKFDLANDKAVKYKSLFDVSNFQNDLLKKNFESQKIIIKNNKIQARKNKLYFFGGGMSVGIIVFAVLLN